MEVSGRARGSSFKEAIGRSSAEDGETFCQPCGSDGDWIVAIGYCVTCNEYQCATCLKVHRKQAMSKHHQILEGENMPKEQECSVTGSACSELCVKHKSEIIKFYCSAHDSVGCGDCMVLDHKVCKVDRIQEISKSYFNDAEHQKLQREVHTFLNDVDKVNREIQTKEKATKETYIKAVNDIKAFKKVIIEYLDSAEEDILAKLDEKKKNDDDLISKLVEETYIIREEVQKLQEKLQLQVSHANELFVTAKQVKARLAGIDENIQNLQENSQMNLYEFIPSEKISDIVAFRSKLGEVNFMRKNVYEKKENTGIETVEKKSILEKKGIFEMKPYFDGQIEIKAPDETSDCGINACVLISPSRIILADGGNKCVKVVNIEDRYLSAKHKLKSCPRGIAVISQSFVAVTLPDEKKIQFLTITHGDRLHEDVCLKTKNECNKIAYTNGKLIVLYKNHVEILSLNGSLIKRFDRHCPSYAVNAEDIAVSPDSVTFYVSDSSLSLATGAVSKYDFYGNRMATFEYSGKLTGMFITRDGTMLFCNWKSDGSIQMMSLECKKVRDILKQSEQVNYPWSVSFCDDTNTLFICNNASRLCPTVKNHLNIFRLK